MLKFQTVKWWIEKLQEYPEDWPVVLHTSNTSGSLVMLSTYQNVEKKTTVLSIDIGVKDASN